MTYLFGFLLRHVEEHEATFDPSDLRDLVDVYLKAQREGMDSDVVSSKCNSRTALSDACPPWCACIVYTFG